MRHAASLGRHVALLLLIAGSVAFPRAATGLGEQVVETLLPNGLKVILLENHTVPLVTFQVWYRVGSRYEVWGKTGLSHMLEHMMFKGTEKVNPAEFARHFVAHGGNYNAFTSRDYTAYFDDLNADHIQVAVQLEADRMQNLTLREQGFRPEQLVVMQEQRLRIEANPLAYLSEQLEATAFQTSPYHWPTIGWRDDLAHLTIEDVQAHYRAYYRPNNAFLVVVGDVHKESLLASIVQAFGAHVPAVVPAQEKNIDPPQTGERRLVVKQDAQQPLLMIGYHVPNLRDPDSYVLEVIAALLARGKSSRLHQSLVWQKQLALEARAEHALLSRDPGLFALLATLRPGKDVAEVEQASDQEMLRLQRELVAERELEKVQKQLEAAFILAQDAFSSHAQLLAEHEITSGWQAIDQYIPSVRQVTPGDIQRVAKRYLISDNHTVGTLIPPSSPQGRSQSAAVSRQEYQIQ